MIKLKVIIDTGLRSIIKSWLICRKTKISSSRSFIVDGKTKVSIAKNAQIINNGSFRMGKKTDLLTSTIPGVLELGQNSKLKINGKVIVAQGVYIVVNPNATLEINGDCFVNANTKIVCYEKISIGKGTLISWDTQICDSDIHTIIRENYKTSRPIEIGEHVWIGNRASIRKGVRIGSGSIIGESTIVTKDMPEKSLAVGNPARIIKTNVEWQI